MSDQREGGIAWTDQTWNPVRGCSRVSPGCVNCYAESVAARFCGPGLPYEGLAFRKLKVLQDGSEHVASRWTGEVRMVPEHLADPLRWKRPRKVFVNSMSDLFHEKLTNEQIAAVFGVMAAAPRHTFQVLTKRARRMREWFEWLDGARPSWLTGQMQCDWRVHFLANVAGEATGFAGEIGPLPERWPLPNVWLGVSAENQETADERIPELLTTPAAVRWVSAEPLLGPIDFNAINATKAGWRSVNGAAEPTAISAFGKWQEKPMRARLQNGIDWVVVGGESGGSARPFEFQWARALRDQCAAAGVPFFMKQAGACVRVANADYEHPVRTKMHVVGLRETFAYRFNDKAGGEPDEWPADLRIREWPEARA